MTKTFQPHEQLQPAFPSTAVQLMEELADCENPQRMLHLLHARLAPYLQLSGISCLLDSGPDAGIYEVGVPADCMQMLSLSIKHEPLGEVAWYRSESFKPDEKELLNSATRLLAGALEKTQR